MDTAFTLFPMNHTERLRMMDLKCHMFHIFITIHQQSYSFSKSLSLPGERIGYIVAPNEAEDFEQLLPAFIASARLLSYVCVPTLYQKVVGECVDLTSDLSIYQKNKDLFYNALVDMGYECVEPGGAFIYSRKALEEDANAFCEKAKEYDLLIVPGDSFGCPGYVRISYCVPTERNRKSPSII